jgi:hypothetical protein
VFTASDDAGPMVKFHRLSEIKDLSNENAGLPVNQLSDLFDRRMSWNTLLFRM